MKSIETVTMIQGYKNEPDFLTSIPRALRKFKVFDTASNCYSCSKKYRTRVRKTVHVFGLTQGRGRQTWPERLPSLWWTRWGVSWPHHSRQSDQWLWQRGFIKALGGRSQQPDVTLRFPSSAAWGKDTWLRQWRSDNSNPAQSATFSQTLNLNSH